MSATIDDTIVLELGKEAARKLALHLTLHVKAMTMARKIFPGEVGEIDLGELVFLNSVAQKICEAACAAGWFKLEETPGSGGEEAHVE